MAPSYFKTPSIGIVNSNLISTLVSLGLHGVALFLVVPYLTDLPTFEPETSDQGPVNVPVIELNPNEQNRLPDQNPGLSGMPEFPNSDLGELPMLDSPSLGSSLPNNFSNLPSPQALPPFTPLPSYNNNYNIPIALPPRRSFTPPPVSRIPLPPPSLQTPTPKTPSVPDTENPQTPDPRQNIDFGDPTPAKPNNPLFQGPNNPNPLANNPQTAANLNNDPNRQDQIIRNLLQDTLDGADNLTYNPQGTKREEARRRDLEWMQQTGVTLKLSQMMTIRAAYPKAACNLKLEGSAIYNVLVNDNGQLRKPPFLTQSSGYGLLNNQGLQAVRSRSFPQSTRVKVVFQYDPTICGTGVVEGERNTQPQQNPPSQPTTPTQPSPSPQTPQNQTPPAPKTPASTPENSTNPTPKTPTESAPSTQPSSAPQTPQNQAPQVTPEPKTPASTPENSTNPTPKTPTEPEPSTQPSSAPQTPQNQTPPAPRTPSKTPPTPSAEKTNPNPTSETKVEGVAAPPAGKK
ncbi:energy transducer TonB [Crocosphaera sp.]|uniref:energy transducer TonB n=1 Tax=Crocosphaera sp. TaxID=2729996 RepID=UPI003F1EE1BD